MNPEQKFITASEKLAFDLKFRIQSQNYQESLQHGQKQSLLQFKDYELLKSRVTYLRKYAIRHWDELLLQFESKFQAQGGRIIWAENAEEAQNEILKIAQEYKAKTILKDHTSLIEELSLTSFLNKHQIRSVSVNPGEWLMEVAELPTEHPLFLSLGLQKKDIQHLLNHKFNLDLAPDPQKMIDVCRRHLRKRFASVDIAISGLEFMLADTGSLCLSDQSGQIPMISSFSRVHIVLAGIEQILPELRDLDLVLPLLSSLKRGKPSDSYHTILQGPRRENEKDGPEELVVVLIDNGRSQLLLEEEKYSLLHCIHCEACLNVCPVYQTIGAQAYAPLKPGPRGGFWPPSTLLSTAISQASTLCGACTQICPVQIDLNQAILSNRKQRIEKKQNSLKEKSGFRFWRYLMQKRSRLNTVNAQLKRYFMKQYLGSNWFKRKDLPEIPRKSFHQQWKQKLKK
ncbi:MAG: LUD domain-containing protein [Bacteroidota bacterium]